MLWNNSGVETAKKAEAPRTRRRGKRHITVALTIVICTILIAAQIAGVTPGSWALAGGAGITSDQPEAQAESTAGEAVAISDADEQGSTVEPGGSVVTDEGAFDGSHTASEDGVDSGTNDGTNGSSSNGNGNANGTKPDESADESEEASEGSATEELDALALEVEPLATEISNQAELEAALDAVVSGGTVTLTQSIELSKKLNVPLNKSFTLNGDGYSLTLAPGYSGRHIDLGYSTFKAPVTFENLIFAGRGAGSTGGGAVLSGPVAIVLSNCTFTNNVVSGYGGGLQLDGACVATVTGCTFTDNTASVGGALNLGSGSIAIQGSRFSGNSANSGGAL